MIKKFIHKIYVILGLTYNFTCRLCWNLRDKISPPKENEILFVAHPDDDTLFFHTYIKAHKPYIVLLTDGWSFRRMSEFKKAMKQYKVKYRAYGLHTRDNRTHLLEKYIVNSLKMGNFQKCITHNSTGEYGHEMHIRVHDAVKKIVNCELLVPENSENIYKYPLNEEEILEKTLIFKNIYKTQTFVLDEYKQWLQNEKLIKDE